MEKGLFITFEGADGCGKSTQLALCKEYLEKIGKDVVTTIEPGAGEFGQKLREILLHYNGDVCSLSEFFLFLADRAQNVEYTIKPAINQGKIVLCDRHTDSTVAYQGYGRGNDIDQIDTLNAIAVNGTIPDLTFLFDVDTEVAAQRVGDEKDRMEAAGKEFHKNVRYGYLELAKKYPKRIKVIDANLPIEEVFEQVKSVLNQYIKQYVTQ